jgi:O-acetyl-ADP-ribose deacetylase (regulator of RNase III)/uncharacterized protein YwgA
VGVKDVRVGNLFDSGAQTLVNTVNCVGVMGKGVAAEFKRRFPEMFEDYVERCDKNSVKLGRPYLWTQSVPWVLNFPTKDHWRSVSRLEDMERGLEYLVANYERWRIESLAAPPLGCGHGGLDWTVVGPTLHRHLDRLSIPVILYAPRGTPPKQLDFGFLEQEPIVVRGAAGVSPGALALVEAVNRITAQRFHPPVGRVKLQKLAYFLTVAGVATGLEFRRGSFGPFASGLKALQTKLVNNGLIEERRQGRTYATTPGRTYPDVADDRTDAIAAWSDELDRVTDLMLRLATTEQAEVAATVHFAWSELASRRASRPTEQDILDAVNEWKKRRNPALHPEEVAEAIRNLNWLGWIDAEPSALPLLEDPLLGDPAA